MVLVVRFRFRFSGLLCKMSREKEKDLGHLNFQALFFLIVDVRWTSSFPRIIIAGDRENALKNTDLHAEFMPPRDVTTVLFGTLLTSFRLHSHEPNDICPQSRRRPGLRFLPSPTDGIELPEPAKLRPCQCLSHTTAYVASNSTRNNNEHSTQQ